MADWFVSTRNGVAGVGVGVGVGVGRRRGEEEIGLLVEDSGWENSSIATTTDTSASQTTEKHSNVTAEGRRMAEQRDMDEFLDELFSPGLQRLILSQIDPAIYIVQHHFGFLSLARAILVRHRRNDGIHLTNEMVAQAIVDAMTIRVVVARQQQPPPPGPAIAAAAAAAVPEVEIPGPADAAGDVSSLSSISAIGSCDTVALANLMGTSVISPTGSSSGGAAPPAIPTPGASAAAGHNKRQEAENHEEEEEEEQRKKKKKKKKTQRPGSEVKDGQDENKDDDDDATEDRKQAARPGI